MSKLPATNPLPAEVQHELTQWAQLTPHLSPAAQQAVAARVRAWSVQEQRAAQVFSPTKKTTTPLLRRPGLPPRPLDPFFFELK